MRKVILVICLVLMVVSSLAFMGCGNSKVDVDNPPTYQELTSMTDSQLIDGYNWMMRKIAINYTDRLILLIQVYQVELNKREIIRVIEANK
jgi:hypothetical protein